MSAAPPAERTSTDRALLRATYQPRSSLAAFQDALQAAERMYELAAERRATPGRHVLSLLRVLALNYSTNLDGPDAEKWAGEFEVELERRGGEMASLLAHRLRAVVHDGPDRERIGPVSVNDSQAALREISLLCVTASAVADRFLIRAGKLEPGDALVGGCVDLRPRSGPPRPRAAIPEPPLVSLTAGSPLEVLAIVPPEVIAGGGFAALLTLAMRVATFPVRVAERWEFYRYERVPLAS